ncbi:MAG: hypothetical protein JWN24_4323 [Phycisphaerales bacterium]|nr:hypothetical protein [Phycisphaerales bacterium]
MRTREITHQRWQHFFDDFTQLHEGEHVNVETISQASFGVKSLVCDLPLVGIIGADPKSGSGEWIELITGDSPDAQASCCVAHPSRVVIAEEEDGQAVALQIESADGLITMIRFEPPREGIPQGFTIE